MAYTPINWQNGDIITAEKFNKMDNGWSDSVPLKCVSDSTTRSEMEAAATSGRLMYFIASSRYYFITRVRNGNIEFMPESDTFGVEFDENDIFQVTVW